jgi:phage terminase large subunit
MFQKTTAQNKIAALKKRIRVVQGGTSSSKTYSIIPMLIDYAIKTPLSEISIVAESVPHLRRGAMKDFIKIMIATNNFIDSNFNKTNLVYHFTNGSYIEFFSADMPDRLRGARRDVLFVNECNNISFDSYYQLAIRTKKFIYLDYNPTNEFWVHTELVKDTDTDFIILTYKDNEALDKAIVKEIEKARDKAKTSSYWKNWWLVYGLGQTGLTQGIIFPDFKIIDTIPQEARLLGVGIDFGFTNDPTTAIELYKYNDTYIANEILYKTGLTNNDIYNHLKHINSFFVADSAEPKSIVELQQYGLNIVGANKGADSINFGIQLLQSKNISVTSQSINLIKEQRNYSWDTDKQGKALQKPIDRYNHCCDALRYIATNVINNNTGKYHII